MPIQQRNKASTEFNLATMSDIVFLLLIFFMLTSSFVQQGVKVDLPQGSSKRPSSGRNTVTISKEGQFYWNSAQVERQDIPEFIKKAFLKTPQQKAITLRTDKEVTMNDAAFVISAIAENGGVVIIATKVK